MTKDDAISGLAGIAHVYPHFFKACQDAITLIEQLAKEVEGLKEVNQAIASDRAHFENAFKLSLQSIIRLTGERDEAKTQLSTVTAERDELRECAKQCLNKWTGTSIPTCFLPLALLLDFGVGNSPTPSP